MYVANVLFLIILYFILFKLISLILKMFDCILFSFYNLWSKDQTLIIWKRHFQINFKLRATFKFFFPRKNEN